MKLEHNKRVDLKEKWVELVDNLSQTFSDGAPLNLDGIIYLIGVQELGQGKRNFKNA